LGKIAVISLTHKKDEIAPAAILEHELWEALAKNDKISRKWHVEKVTILDDAELTASSQIAD